MSNETSMIEASQKWMDNETSLCRFGEKEMPGIRASELYKWLEVDDEQFARWFNRKKKSLQLVDGKDFVCSSRFGRANKGRGGHNKKDYILTPHAALQLTTQTLTPKGLATLRVLSDLALKVNQPDYQFIKAINKRYEETHDRAAPGRPWSERLTDSFMKHYAYVNGRKPGWWSILIATNTIVMAMEDALIDHSLPCVREDLPDGSIGKRWAAYRRDVLELQPSTLEAPLYLPSQKKTVQVLLYDPNERGLFDAWLFGVYIPENLPDYFANKYKKTFGILPPHSAADCTCRQLTNKCANLPPTSRQAIDSNGRRPISAATAIGLPSKN